MPLSMPKIFLNSSISSLNICYFIYMKLTTNFYCLRAIIHQLILLSNPSLRRSLAVLHLYDMHLIHVWTVVFLWKRPLSYSWMTNVSFKLTTCISAIVIIPDMDWPRAPHAIFISHIWFIKQISLTAHTDQVSLFLVKFDHWTIID